MRALACRPLFVRWCATVAGLKDRALFIILALLLIVLAFSPCRVQQPRGLKMRPHRVQQAREHITTPTGSITNAYAPLRIRIPDTGRGPFGCTHTG